MLNYESFYEITGATQHSEFEQYLKDILFKPERRKEFYNKLIKINHDLNIDTFKPYFELYAAERKSHKQDYTPDEVAFLLAMITRGTAEGEFTAYDPTAGTGSLLIKKWWDDMIQETPWSYAPHRYFYRADEIADNVIPYLIHNLTIRGMNATVVHGDVLEGKVKQIYFIQNSKDDFMSYSDVNVMPHSEIVTKKFGVKEWLQDEIKHIESGKVVWRYALPMMKKALEINPNPIPGSYISDKDLITIGDVANVERAKKNKIYPEGSIIIQISATQGEMGLLESDGKVEDKYAVIQAMPWMDPEFVFYSIQNNIKKHLHKYRTGLNIVIDEVKKIPIAIP